MPRLSDGRSLALSLGFVLCVALPSLGEVIKYTNLAVVIAYPVAAFGLFLAARAYILPRVLPKLGEKQVIGAAIAVFAVTIVIFAVIYPIANDPETFGGGSDNDEALDITARELMKGNYPYYVRTYLYDSPDDPIRLLPMPGAILLALPFVALGYSAYQNLFWLTVLFIVAWWYLGDRRSALGMALIILALSPIVWQLVVTGGDRLSNSIYVFVAALWLMKAVGRQSAPVPMKIASALFLGIALSSRANYFFILPMVFSTLVQASGWRQAAIYSAIAVGALAAITLPFYLYDPEGFAPLHTAGKLDSLKPAWDLAPVFIPVATGIIALLLSLFLLFRRTDSRYLAALGSCALVQAFPILCFVALDYIGGGVDPLFMWAGYGLSFLFFGCLPCWAALEEGAGPGRFPSLRASPESSPTPGFRPATE